jgi:hydrogenase expression/formation protein HypD
MIENFEVIRDKLKYINSIDCDINIMEVCGTHTMAIGKHGIRGILAPNINLISGPGCPVCVTPDIYIDYIYSLSLQEGVIIATYGDMMRVPGTKPDISLQKAKAKGANVKMVYSSMDAVKLAEENPEKKVVFLGIGFETTAPATAISVQEAYSKGLNNYFVLSMHKLVEPVMKLLMEDTEIKIDAFLCPGHVATIIGEEGFKFLEDEKCFSVIAGFELEEVIDGLFSIVKSIKDTDYALKNTYRTVVKPKGNKVALNIIRETFDIKEDFWRGMGLISASSLKLKELYRKHDIERVYPIDSFVRLKTNSSCQCGEVLKGKLKPTECRLFSKVCTPDNPVGPCMVSSEGSCASYYRYDSMF